MIEENQGENDENMTETQSYEISIPKNLLLAGAAMQTRQSL